MLAIDIPICEVTQWFFQAKFKVQSDLTTEYLSRSAQKSVSPVHILHNAGLLPFPIRSSGQRTAIRLDEPLQSSA